MVNTARVKFDVLRRDQFFFAGYMSTLTFSGWCYRQIYTIEETLNNFLKYSKSEKVYPHQDFGQLFINFSYEEKPLAIKTKKINVCIFKRNKTKVIPLNYHNFKTPFSVSFHAGHNE